MLKYSRTSFFNKPSTLFTILAALLCTGILIFEHNVVSPENAEYEKEKINSGYDRPDKFLEYFSAIKTREDGKEYPVNYQYTELKKAQIALKQLKNAPVRLNWLERGPGNISGRTRGLIVDPGDVKGNTWYAGSAGGGIWKTTDAGKSWRNLTPDFPNLSTVTLEMSPSDNNVIYAGTGELHAGATGVVKGCGIFKSVNRGESYKTSKSAAKYVPAFPGTCSSPVATWSLLRSG